MKKIASLVALLMVIGSIPVMATISTTAEGFLDRRAESDIRPVQDSAKLVRYAYDGVDRGIEFADPVLRHRKHITDPVMRGAKIIINGTWDMLMKLNVFDRRKGE